jgi:hypothetical protein
LYSSLHECYISCAGEKRTASLPRKGTRRGKRARTVEVKVVENVDN